MRSVNPDDLLQTFMLALCVYREARGESTAGKALVAQVIVNRSQDPKRRWPRTIPEVVCQPLQFSSFNKSDPNVAVFPKEGDRAWADSVKAAALVLSNPPCTFANHYLTVKLFNSAYRPKWAKEQHIVKQEGNHVFLEIP